METIVRLRILSETLDPESISRELRLQPDRSWSKGTKDKKVSRNMAKVNGWLLNSGAAKDVPLKDQIGMLVNRLKPHSEKIRGISGANTVDFSCVIYTPTEPPLYFDKEAIGTIASLGANLDIDLYMLGESEERD